MAFKWRLGANIYPLRSSILILVFHVVFEAYVTRKWGISRAWRVTSSHPAVLNSTRILLLGPASRERDFLVFQNRLQ